MSAIDSPDHVRGAAPAAQLVIEVAGGIAATTFDLPTNTAVLWIFATGVEIGTPLKVVGTTSAVSYPAYEFASNNLDTNDRAHVALISQQTDPTVTVTWQTAPTGPWFIVADSGPRVTVDAGLAGTIGPPGVPPPGWAVQVAGTDGTDTRVLLTDNTGKLITAGGSFPAVYGVPGAANPADALQVAGTDGTDLRTLKTDATGILETADQNVKNTVGIPSLVEPSHAVMVAGTDGVNLQTLLTDSFGKLQVQDIDVFQTIAPTGTPVPSDAILVGGTDGTDIRGLLVDNTGKLVTTGGAFPAVYAPTGTAVPADAILVGATDGVDLRALIVDALGRLTVVDRAIQAAMGAPAAAAPASAVQVGGTDGTDLRALLVGRQGVPFTVPSAPGEATGDRPPNELLWITAGGIVATTPVVAAPGAGKQIRVFYLHMFPQTNVGAGQWAMTAAGGGSVVPLGNTQQGGMFVPPVVFPLTGLLCAVNTPVNLIAVAGTLAGTVGYTIETA